MLRLHERLPEWILKRQALWAVLIIFAFIAWKAMGIVHAECVIDSKCNSEKYGASRTNNSNSGTRTTTWTYKSYGCTRC
jgi:hypothetical protein